MTQQFNALFTPIKIGSMEVKNRLFVPPMETNLGTTDAFVAERQISYYSSRARGGYGLVIVALACVEFPKGRSESRQLAVDDDKYLPLLSKLASSIKSQGAKVALQLVHGGVETTKAKAGIQPAGASAIKSFTGEMSRELTVDEIHAIVARYADAAVRARKAGFDAVEIHGATWYLVAQFLSRYYNKRQDAYGGSPENRARFMTEVLTAVRKAVGDDFPVWIRLNGIEAGYEGATTVEEARQFAQFAEKVGANAIHISSFGAGQFPETGTPIVHNMLLPIAAEIKKLVKVPVMTVGRVDLDRAEAAITAGQVDLIGTGRASIADPELPNKAKSGLVSEIRPCVGCIECLRHVLEFDQPVECTVNAAVGFEEEIKQPAPKRKKVLVIGGGPAGMEAARVAALRGHEVVLYEKGHRLGGKAVLAGMLDPEIEEFINWLRNQVKKMGVQVQLAKAVTPELISQIKPDAVVLGVGSTPVVPDIPGLNGKNVVSTLDILRMFNGQLTSGDLKTKPFGDKIMWYMGNSFVKYLSSSSIRSLAGVWLPFGKTVVVIGGNMAGCQLGEYLVEKGRKVTVVDTANRLASDMGILKRAVLMRKLREAGAVTLAGVKQYKQITEKGLALINKEGKEQMIEADTVALVAVQAPATDLFKALEGKVSEIHRVGDCVQPNHIIDAIRDGMKIGRAL